MLSDVYNWFTEGFDTKDLQEAKALLMICCKNGFFLPPTLSRFRQHDDNRLNVIFILRQALLDFDDLALAPESVLQAAAANTPRSEYPLSSVGSQGTRRTWGNSFWIAKISSAVAKLTAFAARLVKYLSHVATLTAPIRYDEQSAGTPPVLCLLQIRLPLRNRICCIVYRNAQAIQCVNFFPEPCECRR